MTEPTETTDPRIEHVALCLTDVAGKDAERLAGILLYIADAHDPRRLHIIRKLNELAAENDRLRAALGQRDVIIARYRAGRRENLSPIAGSTE